MTITFQKEWFSKIMMELPAIFLQHHTEIEEDHSEPLDPDWDKYIRMEMHGLLHMTTVRDGQKLIGYYVAVLSPQLHHKSRLAAFSDMFYLMPEYRFGWTGVKLVIETEKMLKAMGVRKSYLVTKARWPITMLLKRLGYVLAEKIHTKML